MFDKEKFAKIIKKISETYENQREFSSLSEINRTYLSQYMNMKIDNPPKPDILKKLADASKGIVTYEELMFYCGYTDNYPLNLTSEKIFFDKYVPILKEINLSENDITQFKEILLNITTNDGLNSNISEFISKFSSEKQKILNNIQEKMAEKLWANLKQKKFKSTIFNCPVYGKISAGIPNWAEECLEGYLPIDPNLFGILDPEECFFLKVNR